MEKSNSEFVADRKYEPTGTAYAASFTGANCTGSISDIVVEAEDIICQLTQF